MIGSVERLEELFRRALEHDASSEAPSSESERRWEEYEEYVVLTSAIENDARTMPDAVLAELERVVTDFQREVARLPEPVRDAHREHVESQYPRFSRRSEAKGRACSSIVLANGASDLVEVVRFTAAKTKNDASCDCALRIAFGRTDRPESPRLVRLSVWSAGADSGSEHLCEACGTRWRNDVSFDSRSVSKSWTKVEP